MLESLYLGWRLCEVYVKISWNRSSIYLSNILAQDCIINPAFSEQSHSDRGITNGTERVLMTLHLEKGVRCGLGLVAVNGMRRVQERDWLEKLGCLSLWHYSLRHGPPWHPTLPPSLSLSLVWIILVYYLWADEFWNDLSLKFQPQIFFIWEMPEWVSHKCLLIKYS